MYKAVEQTLEDVIQADCAEETKEANNPKIRKMPELPLPALAPNINTQPESVKRQRMQISTLCNDENPNSLFGKILFDIPMVKRTQPLPSQKKPTPETQERRFEKGKG
jgi:hypothetical protein